MKQYLDLLKYVLNHGVEKTDRTGTGTRSVFGYQMRFNLAAGFPLLTSKKIHLKSVIYELLWFLSGQTNAHILQSQGVHIWDAWARKNGELGPIYGAQWRSWPCANGQKRDQIAAMLKLLKESPDSRRMLVSAWNVGELEQMALPPCHVLFQFYVANRRLSCQLYQRSADLFLGVPFNIASYALLVQMVAQVCHLNLGEFIWTGGDCHVYLNHLAQVEKQLQREPRACPKMTLNANRSDLFAFQYDDFTLEGYDPYPAIPAPVAV